MSSSGEYGNGANCGSFTLGAKLLIAPVPHLCLMLNPEFVILDETDSGLDVDAVRTVSKGIEAYRKQSRGSLLVITHSTKILEALPVDYTHIMVNGKIVKTSDSSLIEEVNENGFAAYENAE